jgi:hypothetical protein
MIFHFFFFVFKEFYMASESAIQASIIKELEHEYPGAVILKTDPSYIQGFPDLLFLQNSFWAALEVKRAKNSACQPNQKYWVNKLDLLSFSKFIYPSNLDRIFNELDAVIRWSEMHR